MPSRRSGCLPLGAGHIAPALFLATLSMECRLCLIQGFVMENSNLPGLPDTAPFAEKEPSAEQIWLHVKPIIPMHVTGSIAPDEDDGGQMSTYALESGLMALVSKLWLKIIARHG